MSLRGICPPASARTRPRKCDLGHRRRSPGGSGMRIHPRRMELPVGHHKGRTVMRAAVELPGRRHDGKRTFELLRSRTQPCDGQVSMSIDEIAKGDKQCAVRCEGRARRTAGTHSFVVLTAGDLPFAWEFVLTWQTKRGLRMLRPRTAVEPAARDFALLSACQSGKRRTGLRMFVNALWF